MALRLVSVLLLFCLASATTHAQTADFVATNGVIWTIDDDNPTDRR